jgi:Cu2+-containing amine oxidase
MPPIEGRLIQTWMYNRSHPDDNHYAHPIDFVPLVDLNLRKACARALLNHHSFVSRQLLLTE